MWTWIAVAVAVLLCAAAFWALVTVVSARRAGRMPLVELARPVCGLIGRVLHRVRHEGWDAVPTRIGPNGLIVAANHTAGLDPVLLQLGLSASIRWLMDRTQMVSFAGWIWRRLRVIPVDFGPGDLSAFREGLAHLRSGGVLGVFPEGGIERPPCQIRPFLPGLAALACKSGAPVLLLWIHGTPAHGAVFRSLFTRSRSVVRVVGVFDFAGERDLREITRRLRAELAAVSGWPLNDEPLVPGAITGAVVYHPKP